MSITCYRAAHSPSLSATALANLPASFPLLPLPPVLQCRPLHVAVVGAATAAAGTEATADEASGVGAMSAVAEALGTGAGSAEDSATVAPAGFSATALPPVLPAAVADAVPASDPAAVPAPGIAPVSAVSLDPEVAAEAALPSQAPPAPSGRPANDPPPSLFVPVAPPPTIAPPGPAH
jgi:hypothetical protein